MVDPLREGLGGFPQDRLWKITGPDFIMGLVEYNDEITGWSDQMVALFGSNIVHYGGNAYYVLGECRKRGYTVEHIEDRL